MNCIQSYTLTNDSDDGDKGQFYERQQSIISKCPEKDLTILVKDLNAKNDMGNNGYEDIMGRYGPEEKTRMARDSEIYVHSIN